MQSRPIHIIAGGIAAVLKRLRPRADYRHDRVRVVFFQQGDHVREDALIAVVKNQQDRLFRQGAIGIHILYNVRQRNSFPSTGPERVEIRFQL